VLPSESRERLLDVAERLFAEKGYTTVKLKDIASALGIAHASLYHHVPQGKEQLFIEVMERHLKRHQRGLERAIATSEKGIEQQLRAIARWFLSQPPLDLVRMTQADFPLLKPENAHQLSLIGFNALIEPIAEVLEQAKAQGEITFTDVGLVTGGVFAMIQSIHLIPYAPERDAEQMAVELLGTLLMGLLPR
jgi:AcrR family transcriptional regulator